MTKTMMTIPASLCFLLSGLGTARAELTISASLVVAPAVPAPAIVPPVPVLHPVPPPHAQIVVSRPVVASPVVTGGQWVFTSQYGWVYMPYGEQYVYTHRTSPYAYVYYPTLGWRWLAAPWVIGSGPYPHFGTHGPFAYAWYRGLHQARHPWGGYYAQLHGRPWTGPRVAIAPRPAHGARASTVRAPARVTAPARGPARVTTPARPAFAPRAVTPARPTLVAQRNVGAAARGPAAPGPNLGGGRPIARR